MPQSNSPKPSAVSPPKAEFVDTFGASTFTGMSVKTLETWRSRNRNQGPRFLKVGRAVRYRIEDLREFMGRSPRNCQAS